jgi:hypothetical protein
VALAVNREQDWPARPASLWINVAGCPPAAPSAPTAWPGGLVCRGADKESRPAVSPATEALAVLIRRGTG